MRRRLAAVGVVGALTACGSDFEDETLVVDLRILAAKAEPPEVFVELGPSPAGLPFFTIASDPQSVRVSVLVVDPRVGPRDDDRVSFEVWACLAEGPIGCGSGDTASRGDDEGGGSTRASTTFPVAKGEGSLESLVFDFEPTAEQLNVFLTEDPYGGFGGLYVQVDFTLKMASGETVRGAKIISYQTAFITRREDEPPPPERRTNQNPRLSSLRVDEAIVTPFDPFPLGGSTRPLRVEPVFEASLEVETYPVITFPDREGRAPGWQQLEERLSFNFFATAGKFDEDDVDTRRPTGPVRDLSVNYEPPGAPTAQDAIWVVTHDDRGGTTWVKWSLSQGAGGRASSGQ